MQKHWDVMRSDNAGESWQESAATCPQISVSPIQVHAHEPETIYVVPIKSDSEHYPPDAKLRVYRSRTGGKRMGSAHPRSAAKDCYVNVLRDAMAVDSLEPCGVYFGTTGGQVYGSADNGDTWNPIVRDLPAVLSLRFRLCNDYPSSAPLSPAHLARVTAMCDLNWRNRLPWARFSTLSKRDIQCFAEPSAIAPITPSPVRQILRVQRKNLSHEPPETPLRAKSSLALNRSHYWRHGRRLSRKCGNADCGMPLLVAA